MATSRDNRDNRPRNIFLAGIALGLLAAVIIAALRPDPAVSKADLDQVSERLAAIETKLTAAPTPVTSASPSASGEGIAALNKDPGGQLGKSVTLTGKVSSAAQGTGFILTDTDGSFVWVHTKERIPSDNATVTGTVVELNDQIAQWKNEPGWPDNDANLTARLREEKVFVEGATVN